MDMRLIVVFVIILVSFGFVSHTIQLERIVGSNSEFLSTIANLICTATVLLHSTMSEDRDSTMSYTLLLIKTLVPVENPQLVVFGAKVSCSL